MEVEVAKAKLNLLIFNQQSWKDYWICKPRR